MTIRCEQCGQENNPQYQFCGNCGAPLRPPVAAAKAPRPEPSPIVSGPSFLGLADEPRNSVDYLLEDEPSTGHGRLYLVLLLLILVGGAGAWYWWSGELPWQAWQRLSSAVSATLAPSAAPATSTLAAPAATPTDSPTPSEPAANAAPAEGPATTKPEAPAATTKKEGSAPEVPATGLADSTAAASNEGHPASDAGSADSPAKPEKPDTAAPPPAATKPSPPPVKVAKAAPAKVEPEAPPVRPEDKLVADGEKYLYGNGVRQDCDRAQRNLLTAARQADAKAYPLLGAMYATGHCVTRDLPTAYRWFARALHQDPGNARVQRDLEVLWNQMTPQERQIAARAP